MSPWMKNTFITGLALLLAGCSFDQPALKSSVDPTLPKPQEIRVITTQNSVAFEWSLLSKSDIDGYYIYRSESNKAMELVGTIKDRFATHYEDQGLNSDTTYQYRFASFTKNNVESDGSELVVAKTLPPLEAVSWIANVDNLPNRAKIVWRPHTNPSVTAYIIQKSDAHLEKWEEIATVKGRLQAEYIDKDVSSGKTYNYRIIAKLFDNSRALPSQSVEVSVKKLPIAVDSIAATKNIPKQIVVSWEAGEQKEFANFRLYRADKTDGSYGVISNTTEKKFIDKIDEDGAVKYYKVTVIDKDGLESPALNIATGLTKALPNTPKFTRAEIKESRVVLAWSIDEKAPLTYRVTKKWGSFINKTEKTFTDIKELSFEDKDVTLGTTYTFSIQAIDSDGLASKPSDEVELFVPKGLWLPHIYAEQTDDNLELPYTNGDFSIHNYLKNSRYGLFLVEQDGFGFVLATKNKGGKHLIKYDKPTRPASTAVLTKALQNLASALNATGISSNIAAEQKTSDHANPKVLKPDFFMQNPDFLNNKSAELEVGFGSGRHLIAIAQKHPEKIFFGVEIYKPAVAQMLGRMTHENLDNIYIVDFDARLFLQTMPSDSLDKIHIHFPVPWNDAPHRRVFVKKFVDESFRVLNQNGKLELRSDDDIYFQDACKLVLSYEQADLHIYKNRDILVSSKYEDRWKKQGKDIYDLTISALKNVNNSNFEYNFDFDKPINIEVAQQLSSGTTTVFDGILVKFEDILIAKDGSFLLKVVLGSVDMPESKYIYSADGRSYFYPSKPLAILDNLRAFNKLKEMVYG